MRPSTLLLTAILSLSAILVQAAGFRLLDIPANQDGPALHGAVWYPCAQPPSDLAIGSTLLSVTKDCPVSGSKLPLVILSHGWGGSFLGHFDTAQTLADAGFVVAAVNHADSTRGPQRYGDLSALVERPLDVRRVIDFMLGSWPDAARLDAQRIGFFGFSRGGYTGLVALGANPVFGKMRKVCETVDTPACKQARTSAGFTLVHDSRIKAAVIADPLSEFFTAQSWGDFNRSTPIQLWSSEHGGDGVTPDGVAAVARQLGSNAEIHKVPGSQHFDFLPPCSSEMAKHAPEICVDPPDFDRAAFHKELNASVLGFFRKYLSN